MSADCAAEPPEAEVVDEEEAIDGVPVFERPPAGVQRALEPMRSAAGALAPLASPVVVQAAVAATGFVAGAATLALVRRRQAHRVARLARVRRAADALPIVGTRSFIVDVHLIGKDP